jgi:ACR3 family arsenite efflux pump ArsB
VYGVFVLQTNLEALAPTLPIACVWQEHEKSRDAQGDKTLSIVGTIAAISISGIVFILGTWYLHMRRQTWGKTVRAISLLVLLGLAIGAAIRVILVSQAFGTPSVPLDDAGETEWSFGQLLTMLLLILPFVSALEIFRGQMQVPHANAFAESDQIPLTSSYGGESKSGHDAQYTYQPNPLFRG